MTDLDPRVYLDAARSEFAAARPDESPSPAAVEHLARDAGYRAAVESAYVAGQAQERARLHAALKPYVHSLEQIAAGPWSRYLDGRAAALAALIRREIGDEVEVPDA